jgi:ABC-type dipeptide/oligopeptide/nickel transport system permease subunit
MIQRAFRHDRRWAAVWVAGLLLVGLWDFVALNAPAFALVRKAALNTLAGAGLAVVLALVLGWVAGVGLYFLETRHRRAYLPAVLAVNIVRSVPQIVGVLLGYVVLTVLMRRELLVSPFWQLAWTAGVIALMQFLEIVDLVRGRITAFAGSDFVPAMLCCGIREGRIVNRDILWKNSRAHLLQKAVSVFGGAVFLQCSIDFIVSVGLSTDVSLSNVPLTLGSLLAKLDSKQDILAVGRAIADPTHIPSLFFEHLQGVSVAAIIVFSLFCIAKISQGLMREYRL